MLKIIQHTQTLEELLVGVDSIFKYLKLVEVEYGIDKDMINRAQKTWEGKYDMTNNAQKDIIKKNYRNNERVRLERSKNNKSIIGRLK